jgi:quercetin dioxygenase-like cupin family protein
MSFSPRCVITGHDAEGRAVVISDQIAGNVTTRRPGHRSFVLWATDTVPTDLDEWVDTSPEAVSARSLRSGTVFRIAEYAPGVAPAHHRTDSVDYALVLSGEIDLVLDDEVVTLHQGDTLVQRGTAHDWVNNSDRPCILAFCLVGAKPRHPDAGTPRHQLG